MNNTSSNQFTNKELMDTRIEFIHDDKVLSIKFPDSDATIDIKSDKKIHQFNSVSSQEYPCFNFVKNEYSEKSLRYYFNESYYLVFFDTLELSLQNFSQSNLNFFFAKDITKKLANTKNTLDLSEERMNKMIEMMNEIQTKQTKDEDMDIHKRKLFNYMFGFMSTFKKVLIISGIILFIAIGIYVYFFINQEDSSKDDIRI